MTNKETIYRQDVLDLAKKGVLISNGNYESVCKAINELPSVNPQEPKTDSWSIKDVVDTFKKHGLIREQEPCEDAISRAEAVRVASGYCHPANVAKELERLPAVTPQPKTGRWIAYEVRLPDRTILNYRCSVCGRKLIGYSTETLSEAPFCHCGAKMVEPQESEDKCKNCEYYRNPDYTRCHECKAESEDKECLN